jgi:SAM-dependent methyltransferase
MSWWASKRKAVEAPSTKANSVIDWGDLRRMTPVSDNWGFDRGRPIDRYYVEKFLATHRADISGTCLEVRDAKYIRRFGQGVTETAVVDIDDSNPRATIVADLSVPGVLTSDYYDCVVLTQTLQHIYDVAAVLRGLYASVAPGGSILISVPVVIQVWGEPHDYWRFTPSGLEQLLGDNCNGAELSVHGFGNLMSSMAFLAGLGSDDMEPAELDVSDPVYPVTACARVQKPR